MMTIYLGNFHMHIYRGYTDFKESLRGSVLAIGKFDGIHLGHQYLLEKTVEIANKYNLPSAVYTFSPNPIEVLHPKQNFKIFSDENNLKFIKETNIQHVILEPFTEDYANISAEDFIEHILIDILQVKVIVVGHNFRFGRHAKGDVIMLGTYCARAGIELHVVKPVVVDENIVSSGLIRKYLENGQVDKAAFMLGRNFFVEGTVIKGDQRGRKLGYPTANIKVSNGINPKQGIYATKVELENGDIYFGATDVGYNPTFTSIQKMQIETYILNFSGDIYGQKIKVFFLKRIRDELRFDNIDDLLLQIRKDIKFVEHSTQIV